MRKFVFSVLLLFIFLPCNLFAADSRNTRCEIVDGVCPAGCNYEAAGLFDDAKCSPCPVGTYNSNSNSKCEEKCWRPVGGEYLDDGQGTYTGYVTNSCPWTITCEAGQYWNGGETKCKSCGTFYTSDGVTVNGSGSEVIPSEDEGICYGETLTINLMKNTAFTTIGNDVYEDKSVEYVYLEGIKNGNYTYKQIPPNKRHSDTVLKKFLGYASSSNNCKNPMKLIFDQDGKFLPLDAEGDTIFERINNWLKGTSGSDDRNLLACWENASVTVKYYVDGAYVEGKDLTCSISGSGSNETFSCKVNYTPKKDGMVFMGYKCTYNNGKPCFPDEVDKLLKRGDEIPPVASEIYLTAQFKECSAGYYCDSNGEHSCPEGTTSTQGAAKAKSDCYMVRGPAGTKFCSKDRCFTLPGIGNIKYNPSFL